MSKFEGTIEDIVFRNEENGWTVASFHLDGSGRVSAVGIMPFLAAGEHVILDGELTEHRDYGEQIKVSSYEISMPQTRGALGKISGLWAHQGHRPRHGQADRAQIRHGDAGHHGGGAAPADGDPWHRPKEGGNDCRIFRHAERDAHHADLSAGRGADAGAGDEGVPRLWRSERARAARQIPIGSADEIDGVGFQTADGIARGLGFQADNPDRLASGVRYVLTQAAANMGHVYLPQNELTARAAQVLGVPQAQADAADTGDAPCRSVDI